MTAPGLTIRGREVREPTLWAVGAVVACFTPVVWFPMVALLTLYSVTDSVVPPIGLVALIGTCLTWWARRTRTGLSRRIWSIGLWFVLVAAAFLLVSLGAGALVEVTGIGYGGPLVTALGLLFSVAFIGVGAALAPFALRVAEVVL
jgi:hypothetical protein